MRLVCCDGTKLKKHCFTEMCSGSEAGLYLRLIDVVYHSTLGLRIIRKNSIQFHTADYTCIFLITRKWIVYRPYSRQFRKLAKHRCSVREAAERVWDQFGQEHSANFIRTSIYDKYLGSMKIITTHLDHICDCKTASGKNLSNGWTYRVFITNIRRD